MGLALAASERVKAEPRVFGRPTGTFPRGCRISGTSSRAHGGCGIFEGVGCRKTCITPAVDGMTSTVGHTRAFSADVNVAPTLRHFDGARTRSHKWSLLSVHFAKSVHLTFARRDLSDRPNTDSLWRVAACDRLRARAIFATGVFWRTSALSSRTSPAVHALRFALFLANSLPLRAVHIAATSTDPTRLVSLRRWSRLRQ
jgi:hypothetical protein